MKTTHEDAGAKAWPLLAPPFASVPFVGCAFAPAPLPDHSESVDAPPERVLGSTFTPFGAVPRETLPRTVLEPSSSLITASEPESEGEPSC